MKTRMLYNHSKRRYEIHDADSDPHETDEPIAFFPRGLEGHAAAMRARIKIEIPEVYDAAMWTCGNSRALTSRAWRAAEIVLGELALEHEGHPPACYLLDASFDPLADVAAEVFGGSNDPYQVRKIDGQWLCDCEDYANQPPADHTGPRCKHTLAVQYLLIHLNTLAHKENQSK